MGSKLWRTTGKAQYTRVRLWYIEAHAFSIDSEGGGCTVRETPLLLWVCFTKGNFYLAFQSFCLVFWFLKLTSLKYPTPPKRHIVGWQTLSPSPSIQASLCLSLFRLLSQYHKLAGLYTMEIYHRLDAGSPRSRFQHNHLVVRVLFLVHSWQLLKVSSRWKGQGVPREPLW